MNYINRAKVRIKYNCNQNIFPLYMHTHLLEYNIFNLFLIYIKQFHLLYDFECDK